MKILVPVKRVPDPTQKAKIKDGHIDLTGASWIVNTFDEYAIETALRLVENGADNTRQAGAEIIVVSLGPDDAAKEIRSCLAMGADRAIHLKTEGPSADPLATAKALASEIQGLAPQIVWLGKQAVDDDQAQVGPMLGELLSWPCVTVVAKLELSGNKAVVEREIEGGREVIEVELPVVLAADKGLNEPRYASLKGIMAAKKKPIDEKAASLAHPGLEILSMALPAGRAAGRIVGEGVGAVPELVKLLREEAKVI